MAQSRQWSYGNGGVGLGRNGVASNRVSIGVPSSALKQPQQSRFLRSHHRRFKGRQLSAGAVVVILSLVFVTSVLSFLYLASQNGEFDDSRAHDDDIENSTDFLNNVPRIQRQKVHFKHGLTEHGTDDAYDSGIDLDDTNAEGYDEVGHEEEDNQFVLHDDGAKNKIKVIEVDKGLTDFSDNDLISSIQHSKSSANARNARRSTRKSKYEKRLASRKNAKRRPCYMKLLNSTELIVEPVESQKFARFSLQYTEREYQPVEGERWEPRFSGHQSLAEREKSFLAHNQKINCGFVKGREGSPSTGFDLVEDDARYISSCHIAVVSCIFGNSDRLRTPVGKLVSRFSRKNVCFVMFVDEGTLQTLSSEGHMLDSMGFIGLWKIVVVKNFPYDDMRRVGKIPKFLSHRLFTSARVLCHPRMAQSRQWSYGNGGVGLGRNGVASNRVSIGVPSSALKQPQQSRFLRSHHRRFKGRQLSAGAVVVILSLVFVTSVLSFLYLASQNGEFDDSRAHDDDIENSTDFLNNVPRIQRQKVHFKHGLTEHGTDDAYDSGIDLDDTNAEGYDEVGHEEEDNQFVLHDDGAKNKIKVIEVDKGLTDFSDNDLISSIQHSKSSANARNARRSTRKSKYEKRLASRKNAKRRPCYMKLLNSTELIVEPVESQKFARFSLQYTEREYQPVEGERWEPRFSGHQSLAEREKSFLAHNQKINCGFVKGREGSPSTGFDLVEDDARYISSCHIAVVSCIFGNSDRLRTPVGKLVSRFSRKNVCFVMFVDEGTLQTLSSEGHMLDSMGFIGLWKIVVVKNFPYDDMRRVGKIPKFLSHRLFTSARYSIWLDSKLRLQLDPVLILEYFLWRRGHEYAISNHYDRHCVWEEVAQNKKLNKYNHTIIDQQFQFYRSDGLERFNASDPDKLLPSNVPEGSLIVRAHTPMSNLFSCLWFNEVDRFTPRDQLSFAYTYFKLRRMNPEKPFYLNMFKDCERRKTAKLFRHRDIVNSGKSYATI